MHTRIKCGDDTEFSYLGSHRIRDFSAPHENLVQSCSPSNGNTGVLVNDMQRSHITPLRPHAVTDQTRDDLLATQPTYYQAFVGLQDYQAVVRLQNQGSGLTTAYQRGCPGGPENLQRQVMGWALERLLVGLLL